MRRTSVALIVLAALWSALSTTSPARAAGIVPTSQTRSVEAASGEGSLGPFTRVSAEDFGLFDEQVESSVPTGIGQASQVSEISALGINAAGSVFTSGISAGIGRAASHFEIVFEVTEATSYALTGSLYGSGDGAASMQLSALSGSPLHSVFAVPNPGAGDANPSFTFTGILDPGQYALRAAAGSCSDEIQFCGVDSGWGSYSLLLTIVPEPSTACLFGLGLAGLAAQRSSAKGLPPKAPWRTVRRDSTERPREKGASRFPSAPGRTDTSIRRSLAGGHDARSLVASGA